MAMFKRTCFLYLNYSVSHFKLLKANKKGHFDLRSMFLISFNIFLFYYLKLSFFCRRLWRSRRPERLWRGSEATELWRIRRTATIERETKLRRWSKSWSGNFKFKYGNMFINFQFYWLQGRLKEVGIKFRVGCPNPEVNSGIQETKDHNHSPLIKVKVVRTGDLVRKVVFFCWTKFGFFS